MTTQGDRQASVRAVTGTALSYNGDWMALFDQDAIPKGPFDQRFLAWINANLSLTFTDLPDAMQALAVANGAFNFTSMGTFSPGTVTNFVTYAGGKVTYAGGNVTYG